jgi:hypothetical protein
MWPFLDFDRLGGRDSGHLAVLAENATNALPLGRAGRGVPFLISCHQYSSFFGKVTLSSQFWTQILSELPAIGVSHGIVPAFYRYPRTP